MGIAVQVPVGAAPGAQLVVMHEGRQITITLPPGSVPGQTVQVQVPAAAMPTAQSGAMPTAQPVAVPAGQANTLPYAQQVPQAPYAQQVPQAPYAQPVPQAPYAQPVPQVLMRWCDKTGLPSDATRTYIFHCWGRNIISTHAVIFSM